MPTPTFHLPLIDGASPISIVNDMNGLAQAADAAMATLATQVDISTVKTLADSANKQASSALTAANDAKSAATVANDAAIAAQQTANTASNTANAAKGIADTAKAAIDTADAHTVTSASLGSCTLPSSAATSATTTATYAIATGSAVCQIDIEQFSAALKGGSGQASFTNKLPPEARPATQKRCELFASLSSGSASIIVTDLFIEPDGTVKLSVGTHGSTEQWTFPKASFTFLIGA